MQNKTNNLMNMLASSGKISTGTRKQYLIMVWYLKYIVYLKYINPIYHLDPLLVMSTLHCTTLLNIGLSSLVVYAVEGWGRSILS